MSPLDFWCQRWESYALERLVSPLVPAVGKLCIGLEILVTISVSITSARSGKAMYWKN